MTWTNVNTKPPSNKVVEFQHLSGEVHQGTRIDYGSHSVWWIKGTKEGYLDRFIKQWREICVTKN